jgi:23S rRNA (guanosine2251-2'-O)-methyltransferase
MVKIKLPRDGHRAGRRRRDKPPGKRPDGQPPESRAREGRNPADRWLYGHHAVAAALNNPARRPGRLLATANAAERLKRDCPKARPDIVERPAIDAVLPPGAVHQGLALLAPPPAAPSLEDLLADSPGDALLVVLDQVTDPQNVGAILRSSAAFGARAVIVPRRHAPPVTGALAKAASGALEHVPLIEVGNLERALQQIKQAGFWCLGLDAAAERTVAEARLDGRLALVMGAEGSGLRRLTAERCDILVRLPTQGPIATLNVSNAAAVALYALSCGRQEQAAATK